MANNYLYQNAPLVEVIAEIYWDLKPVAMVNEARIDPYFDLFREQFSEWAKDAGLAHTERLIPPELPIELLPHKPNLRFRPAANKWPLYQIGPGIFTANITPPYNGWPVFRKALSDGLSALYKAYPIAGKTLRVSRTDLRYINAFNSKFGFENHGSFAAKHLSVSPVMSQAVIDRFVKKNTMPETDAEMKFKCKSPADATGVIRISAGKHYEAAASIIELVCNRVMEPDFTDPEKLLSWFDEAHLAIRGWFEGVISDELRGKLGPRVELEGSA